MRSCNPVLATVGRSERRFLLAAEARRRRTGEWGEWETIRFPRGTVGSTGWLPEITTIHRNSVFSVLDRTLPDGVRHLAISSLSGERPSWWEAQKIKNALAGDEATAIEVYPPQAEVVDEADMYHLWVVPALPFSLSSASRRALDETGHG